MKKLYYTIGEVSEMTDVEPHVLRYWETIFDELSPKKNRAGNRTYREKDITVIIRLKELIQNKKYSTAGAKKALEDGAATDGQAKPEVSPEMKRDLKEIRMFLKRLSKAL